MRGDLVGAVLSGNLLKVWTSAGGRFVAGAASIVLSAACSARARLALSWMVFDVPRGSTHR